LRCCITFIVGDDATSITRSLSEIFLYFVKQVKALDGGFITYNTYTGEVGSSDRLLHEPSINSFPVVEIENQDLLPKDLLSRVDNL